ncbi:A/G-specific adenine glycosylase [Coxiella endosymbiont of Amblyomma americanum]|uniref:A/G-specific adenine glycosylase n=1 Tax=Coxiella endosymbiont of Amblyomma americanum TaxID=325775 RepID=UPI0005823304|nr:A/G-specific adenine glycosylase [Coxiella endosymbiont of Amblyomma americanum]AJC50581.1 DNA glycosylase [Coxiella endosymbiont of Amblyomma americanum]AUJ58913.1 A/G-specific adenine glycosylase [Coxiella-like endosymbiont of Amblyomma americanum]
MKIKRQYVLVDKSAQTFTQLVLHWFQYYGRHNLPWKKDTTPYRVWISEIMLQQTQVTTVIPYFERFIKRFPTLKTLALTNVDKILFYWSGLGYYSRARNLHRTAQILYSKYQGEFPTTIDNLVKLPGIGQSTAGAILSFSMHKYAILLDGNVKRVLARYHALNIPIDQADGIGALWNLAKTYTPKVRCWDYNQAIMDIGAMICIRTPKCVICPLQLSCSAYKNSSQAKFPVKKLKRNRPCKSICLIIIQNSKGYILLEKRPLTGVWGGLWSFPECSGDIIKNIEHWCQLKFNFINIVKIERWDPFLHAFSHLNLLINPVLLQVYVRNSCMITDNKFQIWYRKNSPLPGGVSAPIFRLLEKLKK